MSNEDRAWLAWLHEHDNCHKCFDQLSERLNLQHSLFFVSAGVQDINTLLCGQMYYNEATSIIAHDLSRRKRDASQRT